MRATNADRNVPTLLRWLIYLVSIAEQGHCGIARMITPTLHLKSFRCGSSFWTTSILCT